MQCILLVQYLGGGGGEEVGDKGREQNGGRELTDRS